METAGNYRLTPGIVFKCTEILNPMFCAWERPGTTGQLQLQKQSDRRSKSQEKRSDFWLPETSAGWADGSE